MPTQHALVFSGASSVANYQALLRQVSVPVEQRQSYRLQPQPAANPDVGRDRQRVRDHRNDDDRYRRRERRASRKHACRNRRVYENGSPVTISPAATASDVDNSDLIYGGVRIVAGGFDGDVLTVNGLQSGTPSAGINFSYDAGLRQPCVRSPGAVADYQALMQAVEFGSTSENPTNFGANPTRTLGWGLPTARITSSPRRRRRSPSPP